MISTLYKSFKKQGVYHIMLKLVWCLGHVYVFTIYFTKCYIYLDNTGVAPRFFKEREVENL